MEDEIESDPHEINRSLFSDLQTNWNEPATRGDIHVLGIRVDSQFAKLETSLEKRFAAIDVRFAAIEVRFANFESTVDIRFAELGELIIKQGADLKDYVNNVGWKFFGATITTTVIAITGILGVFVALVE